MIRAAAALRGLAPGVIAAAVLLGPGADRAAAHPLGNFSINHYAGIEVGPDSVQVKYLLDFAEIPSIRELELVDPDRDDLVTPEERTGYLDDKTAGVMTNLLLQVDGERITLEREWSRVSFPAGEGGLSTVRVAWSFRAALPDRPEAGSHFLVWNDTNYEDRAGWKEIRFRGLGGIGIGKTSLRWTPVSDELSDYPEEFLYNPPRDTKAWCHFGPGLTAEPADAAGEDAGLPPGFGGDGHTDPLTDLITADDLGPRVVILALLLAVVLGAGHALEPGHGKALVGAYLIGSKGTVSQAVLLGLVVTLTHTFSVFLLGLGVLLLSEFFVPETLLPWLGFVSGLLVAAVGLTMFRARWSELRGRGGHHGHHHHDHHHGDHDHHDHHHPHSHGHGHDHSHVPAGEATLGSILMLGISGGLVPCPAGIVVLLSAVALGRIAFGLALIIAFSVGLAAVLVAIAVLFVKARALLDRLPIDGSFGTRLGLVSAAVVTVFGVLLAARSAGL